MQIDDLVLRGVIEGVSNTHGRDFFDAICKQLAKVVAANYVFIAKLNLEKYESQTICLIVNGETQANMVYSLSYTPCADVSNDSVCCYPCDVTSLYPQDQLLKDLNIEAYLGTPLRDSRGKVMGLIVAMHEEPILEPDMILTLFEIFSGRISAELEREDYENSLHELNKSLEVKVQQRTEELQQTLENLKTTQLQLIEAEKMAALGNLVAGVAHEVNTPLGVAITAQSIIKHEFDLLSRAVSEGSLTEEHMHSYLTDCNKALTLQEHNLSRAKDLIENFKKTAVDQSVIDLEKTNLAEYYGQVISTLHPMLKEKNILLTLDVAESIVVTTYRGCHAQILTNLISNSVRHAFSGRLENNHIKIKVHSTSDDTITVDYQDNGQGLTTEGKKHIFEPFYTTTRAEGGSGLGMSIVYNLITQKLKGKLCLSEVQQGFGLQYEFPTTPTANQ